MCFRRMALESIWMNSSECVTRAAESKLAAGRRKMLAPEQNKQTQNVQLFSETGEILPKTSMMSSAK
jgi:hypothetical protein